MVNFPMGLWQLCRVRDSSKQLAGSVAVILGGFGETGPPEPPPEECHQHHVLVCACVTWPWEPLSPTEISQCDQPRPQHLSFTAVLGDLA